MEIKKSPEADLEREKSSFVLMGLLIAMCAIFIAFEWSQRDMKVATAQDMVIVDEGEEEMVVNTEQNTPPPPPPAPEPIIETPEPTKFEKKEDATTTDVNMNNEDTGEETKNAAPVIAEVVEAAQEEEEDVQIYVKVQEKAEFPGGKAALGAFLSKNLVYPKQALETGVQGTVIVEFVVEKNGTVTDVKVARSIDPALDKEAVRVVNMMKGWKPAKNGTKNVRSKFRLPVAFRLG